MNKGFLACFLILFCLFSVGFAQSNLPVEDADLYFFWGEGCPHCDAEKEFLEELREICGEEIKIRSYEVHKEDNGEVWDKFAEEYNTSTSGYPMTFVGEKVFIGFSEAEGELELDRRRNAYIGYKNQILKAVQENVESEVCEEKLGSLTGDDSPHKEDANHPYWIFGIVLLYLFTYLGVKKNPKYKRYWVGGLLILIVACFFAFIAATPEGVIKEFASGFPFPLFVFIIAIADGFNPCAFTVLIILLSLLTYTENKRSMLVIGLTFVIVSAIMYFIFIMGFVFAGSWALERYGSMIMLLLGIGITIAGVINLKDYFFFKKGVSLSISEKHMKKITSYSRKIIRLLKESEKNRRVLLAAIGTTAFLAVFVNLVELGCTAILPAVYMAALVKSFGDSVGMMHIFWTLFYSFIYIIPLLTILLCFIYSFRTRRLGEKEGRFLKLIAGIFMLFFGIAMIFFPNLLSFG